MGRFEKPVGSPINEMFRTHRPWSHSPHTSIEEPRSCFWACRQAPDITALDSRGLNFEAHILGAQVISTLCVQRKIIFGTCFLHNFILVMYFSRRLSWSKERVEDEGRERRRFSGCTLAKLCLPTDKSSEPHRLLSEYSLLYYVFFNFFKWSALQKCAFEKYILHMKEKR